MLLWKSADTSAMVRTLKENDLDESKHFPAWSLRAAIKLALWTGAGATCLSSASVADAGGDMNALDEIVVTATRRNESVLDIPYSITAVSGATLEQAHVQSLSDLTKLIPGISFVDQGPASRSNFVIRGINADATGQPSFSSIAGTVSPVSTYIGETPLFLSLHLDDLDRVEVLRGPQGTLYGSGALAGTLRFIPRAPDPTAFSANVEGNFADVAETDQDDRGLHGSINLPLSDIAAFRASAGYQHYAGFINENNIVKLGPKSTAIDSPIGIPVSSNPNNPLFGPMAFTSIQGANTSDLWQTRLAFLVKPDSDWSVLLTYYHQDDQTRGVQAQSPNFSGSVDATPATNPFDTPAYPVSFPTGGVVFPHNGTYDTNDSFLLQSHRKADLVSADLNYDLGFATLSSSTSYYRDRGTDVADGTGPITRIPQIYGFIPRMVDYEEDYDQSKGFVEEVRLVSSAGQKRPLDYVVGLFFQHLIGTNGQTQWIPGQTLYSTLFYDTLGEQFGGSDAAALGDTDFIVANSTGFLDRALFGELTYHVTERWQITGGARFFKQNFSTTSYSALPYCGSYCGTGILGVTDAQNGYSANDHISKLNTSYKLTDALMTYFDYSEGFRRGGANGIPLAGPFAVNPALMIYQPDKTKNYELGFKGTIASVNYTVDAFYINWDNFQLDTQSYLGAYPIAVNGAKARSRGAELYLDGELGPHVGYTLGYTFTNAEVAQNFSILDNAGGGATASIVTGVDGAALPNSPRHMATLAVNYTDAVPMVLQGWKMRWEVNGSYRSSTLSQLLNTAPGTPPPFLIQGFQIWNGLVSLLDGKGLTTSLYAKNIFNQLGVTGGQDEGQVGLRAAHYFITRPRTVGLTVGYRF
jgi:outer membrane receptor protein involved in Fe transport